MIKKKRGNMNDVIASNNTKLLYPFLRMDENFSCKILKIGNLSPIQGKINKQVYDICKVKKPYDKLQKISLR